MFQFFRNLAGESWPKRDPRDAILAHYREVQPKTLKPLRSMEGLTLSTFTQGLGDTMMLTDIPKASAQQGVAVPVFSPSAHFRPLMKFNPFWKDDVLDKAYTVNAPDLIRQYACGNGHYLQRLRRAFGMTVDEVPRGSITWTGPRNRKKVILHFDAGVHANWQRREIHPLARTLYPENIAVLESFIASKPDWEFVQIGNQKLKIKGAKNAHCETTSDLVNLIGSAEWFIGIMSGPLHVATAMQLRCVVVINFPDPRQIYLPTLVVTGLVEEEWFYPQNVHLHQDAEGELVKKYSADNLNRAFDGEVYPFWKTDCCHLIHENL